jgi:inorganic triphosphatase YgiF
MPLAVGLTAANGFFLQLPILKASHLPGAPMEIELKLLIDPHDAPALRDHPLITKYAVGAPERQTLFSTYYDTPDLYFLKHRAGLRVRQTDNGWVQTMKDGSTVTGGLHSRNEWEAPVASGAPDLAALRELVGDKSPWHDRLADPALEASLVPVFSNRFERTAWQLAFPGGQTAELALDIGELERNDAREPISEVELEVKSGDPAPLFDFALDLQRDVPLRIGNESKAQRGYALLSPQEPPLVKARSVRLHADMSAEDALQAIAGNCLEQIQGNETGVIEGADPEHVHQLRVGMRRLRSLLKLYRELAPLPQQLQDEIGWLGGELGASRDWEVLATGTLADILGAGGAAQEEELPALQQAAQAIANANRARAAEAVRSVRYARLMLSLAAWVHGRRWQREAMPEQKATFAAAVKPFANRMLNEARRRLRKRGRHLAQADAEERHRLRIAAKRMRYATEFFGSLYAQRRVKRYVKALSALQDRLGWLNDVSVAQKLLRELAGREPAQALGAGIAAGYLMARSDRELKGLHRQWRALRHVDPPGRG